MSIIIRKYEGGEIFDLPENYVIEGEKNNPFFNQKGSQTVPISFPTTIKNNRLLKFPFKLDKTNRNEDTIRVLVETGSSHQRGLLSVNSSGEKIISANIGFDESEMYAQFSNLQLRSIPGLPVLDFGGSNVSEKVDSMMAHLSSVMKQQIDTEYYIFPILLHHESVESEDDSGNKNYKDYYEILNEVDITLDINNLPNGKIAELKALSNRSIIRYENAGEIQYQVPKGYGVSPFIKVYRILELIFKNYGFEVSENPFKNHRQLKKLVVLNNTMDAVMTGVLKYGDLMPDITIQEFLDGLYAKFGMLYFLDSSSKTVRITFLKDMFSLKNTESINLERFKTNNFSIAFSGPKQIRLKMNRELESASVLYNTYEEFLEKFLKQFDEIGSGSQSPDGIISQIFNPTMSIYGIINVFDQNASTLYSSEFFDWDKKTSGVEYQEVEMKDMCLPLFSYSYMNFLFYNIGFKHLYSEIIVAGKMQDNIANPAKLAFAFAWGLTTPVSITQFKYFYASQYNRDEAGNFIFDSLTEQKFDISLTCNREDGLFNRFWKEYDAFLRHSNQEVTGNLHLSDLDIINMKFDKKVIIDNQPFVIKQIKYKLNQPGNISECTLRTLRLYEPNNLQEEQSIVKYDRPKYYWKFASVSDIPVPEPGTYTRWNRIENLYFIVNGVQIPKTNVSFLLPTEEQFLANETRIYKYKTQYFQKVLLINEILIATITTTVTYSPEKIIYPD